MALKPRIILGLMTFGPDVEKGARVTSLDEFNKFLDFFQARGYHEVDSARGYIGGKQEAFSREAKWKERGLMMATKVYPMPPGNHKPDVLMGHFETSLKELGTDCVDIAYLHAADRSVPFAETLEAMDKLHKAGKFKQLGLSNFTSFEVAEVAMTCKYNNWVRPSIYQGIYNCVQRGIDVELITACHRYGLDVVVYSPVAGGLFSSKYQDKDYVPSEGRYSKNFMNGMARTWYFKDAMFEALHHLREVAGKHGMNGIEIALRWLVHHSKLNIKDGGNDGIIIGASSLQQLEDNINDMEKGPLPEDVVEALDEAWKVVQPTTRPYWHGEMKYSYDTQEVLFGPGAK